MTHRLALPARLSACCLVGTLLLAVGTQAFAAATPKTIYSTVTPIKVDVPQISTTEPVTIESTQMGYDQKTAVVVAQGDVEVVQGDYVLRADQITYYQNKNYMRADGNVSVLQPGGDVYFADHVELTGDMKEGIIHSFRVRLADNSVFAANEARRINPALVKMEKGVYSPCKICTGEDPFWQLKASKVKVDNVAERVTYNNARLEFDGVPVLYSPYFSHPTPDAGPKNGLMAPTYTQSSQLGTEVRVPYYWRIAPDKEAIITPWILGGEAPLLQGDYRQVTDHGLFELHGSGTVPDKINSSGNTVAGNEFRGHIFASGVENMSDYSRWGLDIQRASDDTFLRRYGFGSQSSLTSRLYAETAVGRNYAMAEALSFQGLRVGDDPSKTPTILPNLDGYVESDPLENGARVHAAMNLENLTSDEGSAYRRAILQTGISQPYVTDSGHVFEAELNVRGDFYSINDQPITGELSDFDGDKTRAMPQAALTWRYPLITQVNDASLTVEPIVVAIAQPTGGNPVEIPNQDNLVVELNDTNIFSTQRMPGYDTIDSGSRVAYGMRSQMLFQQGQSIDAMLGQSYNPDYTPFPNSRRLGENFSDYIGRVGFDYSPISVSYRFALDQDNLAPTRNEIWTSYVDPDYQLTAAYLTIKNSPYVDDSKEALASAMAKLTDQWSLYGSGRRDLVTNSWVTTTGGVIYANECFSLLTQVQRIFTRDRDIEPSTEISVRLGFKNFGEFGNQ